MQSWWELGEWAGYSGGDLAIDTITCAFCLESGNFGKVNRWQKESSSKQKIFYYDILRCENCGNLTMVFWSHGSHLHDWRAVPWPLKSEKAPESWPADVGRYWLQATRAQEGNDWDAAAVMAQRAPIGATARRGGRQRPISRNRRFGREGRIAASNEGMGAPSALACQRPRSPGAGR
jgi:hypothetical protein